MHPLRPVGCFDELPLEEVLPSEVSMESALIRYKQLIEIPLIWLLPDLPVLCEQDHCRISPTLLACWKPPNPPVPWPQPRRYTTRLVGTAPSLQELLRPRLSHRPGRVPEMQGPAVLFWLYGEMFFKGDFVSRTRWVLLLCLLLWRPLILSRRALAPSRGCTCASQLRAGQGRGRSFGGCLGSSARK